MKPHLPLALLVALAASCKQKPAAPPAEAKVAPAAAEAKLDPRLDAFAELAFVPEDATGVVRVDLADVAARSPDPEQSLKAFDFILRAQQPTAWQVLSTAGITAGKELDILYLVVGPAVAGDEPYLLAGAGTFDVARLAAALQKTGAAVEQLPGSEARLFSWNNKAGHGAVGSTSPPEGSEDLGHAAVGLLPGLVLFGPPALVRQALASRAPGKPARDVRHGPLGAELLALDRTATVWGAARNLHALPGLQIGHFQAALAAPARDLDAVFLLRARFSTKEQAEAFGEKLRGMLDAAAIFGDRTPIGATLGQMRKNTKLTVDGTTLVATASL